MSAAAAKGKGSGLRSYYLTKIDEMEVTLQEKSQNLRRLEAQRNELNSKGAHNVDADACCEHVACARDA